MPMSEQEKQRYLAEITPQIETMVDAAMLKLCGRTYNGDPEDMRRASRMATLAHGEQNGSSRPHDSLEQIRKDFPDLFSEAP